MSIITCGPRMRNGLRFSAKTMARLERSIFSGRSSGLPPAISGHQNYILWGPRDWTGEVILVLDTNDENERELFASVEDLGQVVSSPWAMPFERRMHIFLCRDLKISVQEFWPSVKNWL